MNYPKKSLKKRISLIDYVFLPVIFWSLKYIDCRPCSSCKSCKVCTCFERILTEEEELELKRKKAEEFKNKIFIIEQGVGDGFLAKFNSSFHCVKDGIIFKKNSDIIKDLRVVKEKIRNLCIIIPKKAIENENYHYNENDGLFEIKGEGVVVYFLSEDNQKIVYIYHRNIKEKLNYSTVPDSCDWYYEGYPYERDNIDSSELDFKNDKWVVSRAKYLSNDLMALTFHKEKGKS